MYPGPHIIFPSFPGGLLHPGHNTTITIYSGCDITVSGDMKNENTICESEEYAKQ